jgi:transcriptional regulator NrdR family protein
MKKKTTKKPVKKKGTTPSKKKKPAKQTRTKKAIKKKPAKKVEHEHLVKRHGHKEGYDDRKVYASVYWAAMGTGIHAKEEHAEAIAQDAVKAVNKWIEKRDAVNSQDIFNFVSEYLKKHDKHTQYMYSTLRDIS